MCSGVFVVRRLCFNRSPPHVATTFARLAIIFQITMCKYILSGTCSVLEIRIKNWSAIFLKIGYFISYRLLFHCKFTGDLVSQMLKLFGKSTMADLFLALLVMRVLKCQARYIQSLNFIAVLSKYNASWLYMSVNTTHSLYVCMLQHITPWLDH